MSAALLLLLEPRLHPGDSPGLLQPPHTFPSPDLPAAAAVNNIQHGGADGTTGREGGLVRVLVCYEGQ